MRETSRKFRYSYNVIGFGGEDVALSIDRLARLGYDAVEVEGEPERHDATRIRKLAEDAGLTVDSVCTNFTEGRDLSHPDPETRSDALAYLRDVSEFAAGVGPRSSSSPRPLTPASRPSPTRSTSGCGPWRGYDSQ